ncbi:hypothetical protein FOMPIDRAFT_110960 [Fomitopsis schrenkii]|uniref:Protein NO VEIN C-terminal domain-containing protein n=1 Tax=Fomitopsis schrenkii TaxID=2126942 RepID=S8FU57_FOMSC|nr:hypothetical protein FOMPIDRAFT_110960 [Fomitopsis schrenkii]
MDLIQKINRSHGLGDDDVKRAHDDPVVVLRGRLERACERLSRDLYNTKTHFLLEFIENADDNDYDAGTIPNLQLKPHERQLLIRCNERGFRADNVEAICDDSSHPSDPGWTTFRLDISLGPDLTEDNWTSELRGLVPGFSQYSGTSMSDFRYEDSSGVLTNLWFGTKQKKENNCWPTFHLEVKTTSGGLNEPFHMSSAQPQLACQFSSVAQASRADPPQDVYAIIRVSEIKSEHPKHCVYLDPYKWICEGGLVIRGDVDLVPP